ncbi:hypothetical protein BDZ94DRAFT_1297489 [Collybia nuda]|uniref:Uncharacterized protein n=1 Tax=Collybia nuda TaxID=64659 RepID=A0A9P5YAE2_9AGAR|nr:hypothetical protein BDZ94DRAFT_1297489 [Collybia nuda]
MSDVRSTSLNHPLIFWAVVGRIGVLDFNPKSLTPDRAQYSDRCSTPDYHDKRRIALGSNPFRSDSHELHLSDSSVYYATLRGVWLNFQWVLKVVEDATAAAIPVYGRARSRGHEIGVYTPVGHRQLNFEVNPKAKQHVKDLDKAQSWLFEVVTAATALRNSNPGRYPNIPLHTGLTPMDSQEATYDFSRKIIFEIPCRRPERETSKRPFYLLMGIREWRVTTSPTHPCDAASGDHRVNHQSKRPQKSQWSAKVEANCTGTITVAKSLRIRFLIYMCIDVGETYMHLPAKHQYPLKGKVNDTVSGGHDMPVELGDTMKIRTVLCDRSIDWGLGLEELKKVGLSSFE